MTTASPERLVTGALWTRPSGAYTQAQALDDLPAVHHALAIFLDSKMLEAEEFVRANDPKMERLYFASGYGLIQCIKGLMSFEDKDLAAAIADVKHGAAVAQAHRRPAPSFASRLAGLVLGGAGGVAHVRAMTPVQRHAELVYAECLLEKAVLGVVYSGDWLQFIKEALNMRTATGIYRNLFAFLQENPADIDEHFRSGVYLGTGMTSLVLSLMPSRVLTIIELFGYKGDRMDALKTLELPGGWAAADPIPAETEGVRRSVCDMALLIFHLVLSSFTVQGIDLSRAERILHFNLARYPNGVLPLFAAARLYRVRAQPRRALAAYDRALAAQDQYPQLHYIAWWELAICNLCLWRVAASVEWWRKLEKDAGWSKACYAYGTACCLLELGGDQNTAEAKALFERIPSLLNRIGGKSIPIEKFAARKARKFTAQGGRLTLPALELAYFFLGIAHAPREVVRAKMLPLVDAEIERLRLYLAKAEKSEKEKTKDEYSGAFWDDWALAHFLRGVCARYVAYPDPDAKPGDEEPPPDEKLADADTAALMKEQDAAREAKAALDEVLRVAPRIAFDHYLIYYAHYELGRLAACADDSRTARAELELVVAGRRLEGPGHARKGKYSMENALLMRAHAALEAMERP